ncbi:MAG TPA: PVC-type heme-binding CxxCH protein [Bryobacterales bacterium]|nr:PVC-type heme-binding CxxCH protein [Bryobacterales bacterium]
MKHFLGILFAAFAAASLYAQGYSVKEADKHFLLADGFHATVYAGEPEIRQPILVKFDDRGRLWTIQYLQYPNPAGLKRVSVDRYSRTIYDRVPEPPPRGPKGADRITIMEDTDGDGHADKFKDFVSDLNLCTGLAFGYGGVFVLQSPYLLFYPDRNRDDVPDGDPEVLLSGFGMEDAQSMANHLTWGPDGWLYGLNGSTTTAKVRGLEFQQGVWRYHPVTHEVELFAEGGGNIYGLTFDADGNLFYSSNGSALFWHAVQGGYYEKNFGKHGPLHNPYTYGYFPHVKNNGVNGGHIVLGGTIYSGESFPTLFRGTFIGGNFLSHNVSWWRVQPLGSTVQAVLGGQLFDMNDTWSDPTDLAQGPDGAIYVSDLYEIRKTHPDPDAQWDRSNGRIYKLFAEGTKPIPKFDLEKLSSGELVKLLSNRDGWFADQARLLLASRRDASVYPELRRMALDPQNGRQSLQGLWALYVSGGFDDALGSQLLKHPYEYVRSWTVRLLGDAKKVSPEISRQLHALARTEPSVVVRSQLASTAKRLPPADSVPIITALLDQNKDADDPRIPLLIWWALEDKAFSSEREILAYFARPAVWNAALTRDDAQRLIRRYAAEGSVQGYEASDKLLRPVPSAETNAALEALNRGLSERAGVPKPKDTALFVDVARIQRPASEAARREYAPVSGALRAYVAARWRESESDPLRARVALRAGVPGVEEHLLTLAAASARSEEQRRAALDVLEELGTKTMVPKLLPLLEANQPERIRLSSLRVLERFDDPSIATKVLALYEGMPSDLKSASRDLLFARAASAAAFLDHVEAGPASAKDVPVAQIRLIAALSSKDLDARVRKIWGNVGRGTPEEKLATIRRYTNDLRAGTADQIRLPPGDVKAGFRVFTQLCARCHKLFGFGGDLGMDLTNSNRRDTTYLLTQIVDPSVYIRKEYMSYDVRTQSGRVLSGLMAEEDAASITLMDADYRKTRIPRSDIAKLEESEVSIMPEGLLDKLTPQQRRDLFAYLQSPAKP